MASRWAIDFRDWPIERARQYSDCFAIVEQKVKPFRAQSNRKVYRERWWQYAETRPALRRAIAKLDRVLVIARHSRTGLPQFVTSHQVLSDATVTFATNEVALLALLSSSYHYWWAITYGSSIKGDLRYTPSDIYGKFPKPQLPDRFDSEGEQLDIFRPGVMTVRRVGLTALYNLVHNETIHDDDIARLREIHVEIDEAVREAYALDEERESAIREYEAQVASERLPGWREIELGHGFHETRQGMRFTISAQARADVLDKLLALEPLPVRPGSEAGVALREGARGVQEEGGGTRAIGCCSGLG